MRKRFFEEGLLQAGIDLLTAQNATYKRDGALWFNAAQFGDEKDRILIRSNGEPTYFASDVAYHLYKYQQNYDQLIDIFGSDHHGYVGRIKAFLKGLNKDPARLNVRLVQFVSLFRGQEKIGMTTRGGSFVTLRELREEVGNDAARYFYIMRKPEQPLDFDLELAKSKSNENPVYYIQYAYARICSVWRQLEEKQWTFAMQTGIEHLNLLNSNHESQLITCLTRFPEITKNAGEQLAPQQLATYLQEVATYFHAYYNAEKFLVDDETLRNARLCLLQATRQILKNGLHLLGLSTPQTM